MQLQFLHCAAGAVCVLLGDCARIVHAVNSLWQSHAVLQFMEA
jgi:hypothetical protein